jgi:hypothetical protein
MAPSGQFKGMAGMRTSPETAAARLVPALAALLASVALGACGMGSDRSAGPGVPTAVEHGAPITTAAPRDEVNDYVDAMRAYARCLRAEGLAVGDPDETGVIDIPNQNKTDPKRLAAQATCEPLRAPIPASVEQLRRPKQSEAQIETTRRYARCMQQNGAPDFPDPGPDGYVPRSEEEWDQAAPGAFRAGRTCAPIIGDPPADGPGVG